jgi:hypothetical protein
MLKLTRGACLTALTTARFGLAAAAWFAPRLAGRVILVDAEANPVLPYTLRLFGVRDALMGILLVQTSGRDRDRQLWYGIAIDGIDASAAVIGSVRRQLSPRGAILSAGASLVGASLGAGALGIGPLVARRNPAPPARSWP